jgi:hypothetical protein
MSEPIRPTTWSREIVSPEYLRTPEPEPTMQAARLALIVGAVAALIVVALAVLGSVLGG